MESSSIKYGRKINPQPSDLLLHVVLLLLWRHLGHDLALQHALMSLQDVGSQLKVRNNLQRRRREEVEAQSLP